MPTITNLNFCFCFFFQSCFFLQHYVLYRQSERTTTSTSKNGEKKSMGLLFEEFYHNQELV